MAILQAKTKYGIVEGLPAWNQAFTVFKGIPFAKAPVGELRWKAPQPPEAWDGVRQCYKFAPAAMSGGKEKRAPDPVFPADFFVGTGEISEDCLYLNVCTPAKSPDEKLPVAMYIHGGGFMGGRSFGNAFDGNGFCKRGMVYVSIAYRLGVFGFIAHPELSAENEHGASGNYGIMDQIAALRWIKENISAFGGDPENVAIFGQSAGGMSVQRLCTSPLTEGLFHRAIIQSGGGGLQPDESEYQKSLEGAEKIGKAFFEYAGFDTLADARAIDAERLLDKGNEFIAAAKIAKDGPLAPFNVRGILFQPSVDGYVIPETMRETYLANRQHDVQYMIGGAVGDRMFGDILPAMADWADVMDEQGNPAYVYYFTYTPPGAKEAHHSVEHHYVFQTLLKSDRPYTGFDFDLSNELANYWANFMKTGNPNGDGEQKWTPYTKESPRYLEIGTVREMKERPKKD